MDINNSGFQTFLNNNNKEHILKKIPENFNNSFDKKSFLSNIPKIKYTSLCHKLIIEEKNFIMDDKYPI